LQLAGPKKSTRKIRMWQKKKTCEMLTALAKKRGWGRNFCKGWRRGGPGGGVRKGGEKNISGNHFSPPNEGSREGKSNWGMKHVG